MLFFPLPDAAVRQYIDSNTVFQEWLRVRAQAGKYSGGMYFKKQGDYEYLVKTNLRNRQQRIGPRSLETENIHATFHAAKDQVQTRLDAISQELKTCERLNKAVQVGRVPNTVVDILQKLQALGLHEHFVVVGTHALYAYEAAASVRMVASALATQDIDLLWDARKRVRFVADMDQLGLSMLDILQQVDKSFERKEGQNETAINAQGFEVDFLPPRGLPPRPPRRARPVRRLPNGPPPRQPTTRHCPRCAFITRTRCVRKPGRCWMKLKRPAIRKGTTKRLPTWSPSWCRRAWTGISCVRCSAPRSVSWPSSRPSWG